MKTALSVNLNKIALLRNSRGRDFPSVVEMGALAIDCGAAGLTIHPRPDQRHAKYSDIKSLKELCASRGVELNIEGYPTAELIQHCLDNQVDQVTLVPDAPNQITSDHGWIVSQAAAELSPILAKLRAANIRSSLFMDTDIAEIKLAKEVGADRIELHTESYARAFESGDIAANLATFKAAYDAARAIGLGVNAGHDLNLANLGEFLAQLPVDEVSIGHALTVESLLSGWQSVIAKYVKICQAQLN